MCEAIVSYIRPMRVLSFIFIFILFACSPKTLESSNVRSVVVECVFLGVDQWENPRSEVYVVIDGAREKISDCQACETIAKDAYHTFDIPSKALSACGGWWAGAGDYFYALKSEDGSIEVYAGWQDEGQMEDNDTSFHWELKAEYE